MAKQRSPLRAGIFMIVTVAVIIGIIVGIVGLERFTTDWSDHVVSFRLSDDIGGLRVGDDVRVGGYKAGIIEHIDVQGLDTPDVEPTIHIAFSMPSKYVLRQGAEVAIQETVTGTAWLNIYRLGTGQPLGADQAIAGKPSMMSALASNLKTAGPDIGAILADVRNQTVPKANRMLDTTTGTVERFGKAADSATDLITYVRSKIDFVLDRYHNVTDRGAEMFVQVRDILGDSKGDIRGVFANLNTTTGSIKEKLPEILDQLNTGLAKMQRTIDGLNETLVDVRATMSNATGISDAAKELLVGNRSRIDGMIASLKTTADNLKGASAEIRRSPWRLLYKPKPNEMANLNLFDSARQFAEGANDLNDAAGALRDALAADEIDEKQIEKLLQELETTYQKFNVVEHELWEGVKE